MGLKPDREVIQTNVRYRIETGVDVTRGHVLIADATDGVAAVPTTLPTLASTILAYGGVVGLLLDDVENVDWTTTPQIWTRNVQPRGSEISVLTKGRVKTDVIPTGVTPAQGELAYLADNGEVSNVAHVAGSGFVVGRWASAPDADGYAHLDFDINMGYLSV
jgi:hypothetical protein